MAASRRPEPPRTTARIVEALLVAIIAAAVSAFLAAQITIARMDVKMDEWDRQMQEFKVEMKQDIRDLRGAIYRPSWERERERAAQDARSYAQPPIQRGG